MNSDDDFYTRIPRFLRREGRSDPRPNRARPRPDPEPSPADRIAPRGIGAPTPVSPVAAGHATVVSLPTAAARRDTAPAPGSTPARPANEREDAPFPVTLPEGLVRQIRVRAAEEGTTHRAILLRALELYGFVIPDGQDAGRPKAILGRR